MRPRARAVVSGVDLAARATGLAKPPPLEADHATAPAPYRKTGAAPRREVLNCRQSTGCRFKIRDHHSSRLHQIRPGVPAHMQPMVRRTAPTKAPSRNPCQSDSDSRKSNVRLTRACAESSRMTWGPNPQPGAPHVGEEVSRPRVENGVNATTPEGHEIPPGSGRTHLMCFDSMPGILNMLNLGGSTNVSERDWPCLAAHRTRTPWGRTSIPSG